MSGRKTLLYVVVQREIAPSTQISKRISCFFPHCLHTCTEQTFDLFFFGPDISVVFELLHGTKIASIFEVWNAFGEIKVIFKKNSLFHVASLYN